MLRNDDVLEDKGLENEDDVDDDVPSMRTRPKTWNSRTNERTRSSMTRSMCPRGIGRLLEGENEKREDIDLDDKDLDVEVVDVVVVSSGQ